jgi:hypothetical protein
MASSWPIGNCRFDLCDGGLTMRPALTGAAHGQK